MGLSMAPAGSTSAEQRIRHIPGGGRLLTAGFERVERHPALALAREEGLRLVLGGAPSQEVAAALEADLGLTCAIVRSVGQVQGGGPVRSVPDAVDRLGPAVLEAILRSTPTYDLLGLTGGANLRHERLRLHVLGVQRAADRIAEMVGIEGRDELALAAILHDIGRLALGAMHPHYEERFDRHTAPPDDRVAAERREFGMDHALIGGVLVRSRWSVKARIADAVAHHHDPQAEGMAAVIRVADMITAHLEDAPMDFEALGDAAAACGLDDAGVSRLLYELPMGKGASPRVGRECPLSARELEALRLLAAGKVYKEIARELGLSASTVRTHLHNVYRKLGAVDRAQAVLTATDQGWI